MSLCDVFVLISRSFVNCGFGLFSIRSSTTVFPFIYCVAAFIINVAHRHHQLLSPPLVFVAAIRVHHQLSSLTTCHHHPPSWLKFISYRRYHLRPSAVHHLPSSLSAITVLVHHHHPSSLINRHHCPPSWLKFCVYCHRCPSSSSLYRSCSSSLSAIFYSCRCHRTLLTA